MLAMYHHYAWRQALTTPTYQPLSRALEGRFGSRPVTESFAGLYGRKQRSMVRWWNYLGSNAHLLVLSAAILMRRPQWYLWGTAVAFTLYAALVTVAQARPSRQLIAALGSAESFEPGAVPGVPPAIPADTAARTGAVAKAR